MPLKIAYLDYGIPYMVDAAYLFRLRENWPESFCFFTPQSWYVVLCFIAEEDDFALGGGTRCEIIACIDCVVGWSLSPNGC